jgi:hypothetical protein
MNLRWLWLDHFPPGMELTEAHRAEARKRAREHRLVDRNFRGTAGQIGRIVGVCVGWLIAAFLAWIFLLLSFRGRAAGYIVANVTGILVFQGFIWLSIAYATHVTYRPYIRKALCDMGLPVCVECGYILTGIAADAPCPECGAKREPLAAETSAIKQ